MYAAEALVGLSTLQDNIRNILSHAGNPAACLAVKANAYGHGLVPVAQAALEAGVQVLGVAQLGEALELRKAGIKAEILHFGSPDPSDWQSYAGHGIETFVFTEEQISLLSQAGRGTRFILGLHLKVDSGMARLGCRPEEAGRLARLIHELPGIRLAGTASHFAIADSTSEIGRAAMAKQLDAFSLALDSIRAEGLDPGKIHAANSAASLFWPQARFDMVRLGISAYGYYPSPELEKELASELRLVPAMEIRTRLAFVKRVAADTPISYGWKARTQGPRWIGTIPIGYADGLRRSLSGRIQFSVAGRIFPQLGTICMDQCMVDLGDAGGGKSPPAREGDQIILMGPTAPENAATWADKLGSIPYEVCCGIGERVKRVYSGA